MKKCLQTFWACSGAALLFGLLLYALLSLVGVLDHRNISHSKILVPQKGTYGCDLIEVHDLRYMKNNPTTIRSVSVTCQDHKSTKVKKYTFTQYDGLPKYIIGLDNHEGWYVNSVDIITDSTLEPGEGHVYIYTTKKPLNTKVSIILSETDPFPKR